MTAHPGHIEFDMVSLRYRPDQPLFEGVSLQVLPGQTVAIVGPTGAGKTTLMNLLLRFYEVDTGCIRLDGIDIRTLTREALRSHFGVVPQETWLFAGSIHDDIAYRENGNVVEQGSHAVLKAAKGRYWALYESQFSNEPISA